MSSNDRPVSVTVVAWIFIAVGAVNFIYHSRELLQLHWDAFLIEFVELLALIAGLFMLRCHNWARWLALAWMAFHIILTAFPPFHGLAVHIIIFTGIAILLLRADATKYFRGAGAGPA
jgi:hypothetical protein